MEERIENRKRAYKVKEDRERELVGRKAVEVKNARRR